MDNQSGNITPRPPHNFLYQQHSFIHIPYGYYHTPSAAIHTPTSYTPTIHSAQHNFLPQTPVTPTPFRSIPCPQSTPPYLNPAPESQAFWAQDRRKRKYQQDENIPPNVTPVPVGTIFLTPKDFSTQREPKRRKNEDNPVDIDISDQDEPLTEEVKYSKAQKTSEEGLIPIFKVLANLGWTLSDMLYYMFRLQDNNGQKIHRSRQHAAYVSQYLKGRSCYGPGFLLDAWERSPDGVLPENSTDHQLMFNTAIHFMDVKPVRAALTSYAAQTMKKRLVREAENAVKPSSGLHTHVAPSKSSPERVQLQWTDIGSTTMLSVADIIKKHQPLTWEYVTAICARKPRVRNGLVEVRKTRPIEGVATTVISSMNMSRNQRAQRLGMARGILDFASCVPYDAFVYNSRVASSVSYGAVYGGLQKLSQQEALVVREHGRDQTKGAVLVMDNVQNYLLQRDARIGRANTMNVGIAATYIELEDIDPKALDLQDKQERLNENKRKSLSVEQLLQFIDQRHLDTVFSLQWLLTLVNYVPALTYLKTHISMLYRTRTAKLKLPVRASNVHPLATSGKNETVTTELKDALLDFMEQTGQSPDDYQRRLMLMCGDGLTYEKIHQLKKYRQFHEDELLNFELVEPTLAFWHTQWTDLSRNYETHWGDTLSRDPSTLGHSATKIGRNPPPNLKKVDYYPYSELAYLQDDLFKYFNDLAAQDALPPVEELEEAARKLHRAYSNTRALHHAASDAEEDTKWAARVPLGSAWGGIQTGIEDAEGNHMASKQVAGDNTGQVHCPKADFVLAKSIAFMRDLIMSREAAYAAAEGDVGRVYEALKIMLFTFAGSTHTKYITYLLEQITTLELESSPELRDATLRSSLVNLTGRAGSFCALDFMQEYFNRLLEAIVQRKGAEYGAEYIRTVVARNLHHFGRIKKEFKEGVGLSARSGRHTAPHTRPEMKILLKEYKDSELHLRRPGRKISRVNIEKGIDDFERGIQYLRKTKLPAWIKETTATRGLRRQENRSLIDSDPVQTEHSDDTEESAPVEDANVSANEEQDQPRAPLGDMFIVDGELIIDTNIEADLITGFDDDEEGDEGDGEEG
ncbi:hypothetical protein BJ138DRAFT_1130454 [Hygrophoropsis aurantiaca]|uniref:Uncharacterized protein n=1 Tax=Hygrophoropsis aurantiaca TaxID=72124 RepID=A0ACB7ZX36_9AGAM|nr:hypothetical protein BJ138DRAFT_1130454 [Hygrophoropsis aurantiaca]